jgi:hypothetical protein
MSSASVGVSILDAARQVPIELDKALAAATRIIGTSTPPPT